jgi:argininosuccinate lyase
MVKKRKKKDSCTIDTLWGDRLREESANGLLAFTSGRDVRPTPPYDERLIAYDIWGSKAHAIMLWKQNIISRDEAETLLRGLKEVETLYAKGTFIVDPAKEDVHSTIETYLIEHYGMESAGRLHTGRSRNDQIVLDLRLYMRAEVLDFVMLLISLIETLTFVAKDHRDAIMPGYTHHQPGMIGSWGHLLFSFALPLERDVKRFINWYGLFNYNPLGGAAGYGTRLPLDRKLTARLMGFDGVHRSSLDPVHNRWEPESELGYAVSIMMNHLSNLAQTIILLSTSEFGMVSMNDAYCTGSSLMPQKRNPDPLEAIKGKSAYAQGMVVALLALGRSLFAGYNRESQWSKYPLMDVVEECKPSLPMMKEILASLTFNRQVALECCRKGFVAATDVAEWLVQKHALPFRKAKMVVEKAVAYSEQQGNESVTSGSLKRALADMDISLAFKDRDLALCQQPERVLQARKIKGGPSPATLMHEIELLQKTMRGHVLWLKRMRDHIEKARKEVEAVIDSLCSRC